MIIPSFSITILNDIPQVHLKILLLILVIQGLTTCGRHSTISKEGDAPSKITLEKLVLKYDTLIPVFNGYFITYDNIDINKYNQVEKKSKTDSSIFTLHTQPVSRKSKKWGLVDSTGKVIVPFICDGIKSISGDRGVFTVFVSSYSLNTGIPR